MKLNNTLSGEKEEFSVKGKHVKMYTCGPTVYDYAHVGNLRSFTFADLIKRYLKFKGFKVDHVMNITDIDDKIIKKVNESGKSLKEITSFYENAFMDDMKSMGMDLKYKKVPRATETIKEMVDIVQRLLEKGVAYKKDDGIYFSISKFPGYGKLSKIDKRSLKAGARISQDQYDKENAQDFALWKFWKPEDGEVFWETPLGKGRPGWHIECSAMSMSNLGETLDLHTGGIDLIFPHHENEIAQSEAATGKPFVRHWIHSEHLMVDGKKMSKSLGNFYTLRDLIGKGYDARTLRLFYLMSHYRSQQNLTTEALDGARNSLERIDEFVDNLKRQNGKDDFNIKSLVANFMKKWEEFMDDDLNTVKAVADMFIFMRDINKKMETGISKSSAKLVLKALESVDEVFAILPEERKMPNKTKELIAQREAARKKRDYAASDKLRKDLESMGVEVKDMAGKDSIYRMK